MLLAALYGVFGVGNWGVIKQCPQKLVPRLASSRRPQYIGMAKVKTQQDNSSLKCLRRNGRSTGSIHSEWEKVKSRSLETPFKASDLRIFPKSMDSPGPDEQLAPMAMQNGVEGNRFVRPSKTHLDQVFETKGRTLWLSNF